MRVVAVGVAFTYFAIPLMNKVLRSLPASGIPAGVLCLALVSKVLANPGTPSRRFALRDDTLCPALPLFGKSVTGLNAGSPEQSLRAQYQKVVSDVGLDVVTIEDGAGLLQCSP